MSDVEKTYGEEPFVQVEEPKEKFGKKVKRKTLNFLAKNGVWIVGGITGGVVGHLVGKHKTKKSVVSQEELGEPKEDYKQKVYVYEEATRIRRVKISSEKWLYIKIQLDNLWGF